MDTRDRQEESGAPALLAWSAVEEARRRGLVFDFDGVHNRGQCMFLAGFTGRVAPRYVVLHASRRGRLVRASRLLRGLDTCNPFIATP